jgi:hypothetical protein
MTCEVAGAHGGEYVITLMMEAVSTSALTFESF